ncbi:hypothetical protein C0J52_17393 [Blattella germanica]|nr:hypothetical protein C0J52_17393 [Blattella germanica]
MEQSRPVKRVILNNPEGQRCRGRPKARWEDDVEKDARNIGIENWTSKALKKIAKTSWNSQDPEQHLKRKSASPDTDCHTAMADDIAPEFANYD